MQYKEETDHWSVSREESMKKIYQKNLLLFFDVSIILRICEQSVRKK